MCVQMTARQSRRGAVAPPRGSSAAGSGGRPKLCLRMPAWKFRAEIKQMSQKKAPFLAQNSADLWGKTAGNICGRWRSRPRRSTFPLPVGVGAYPEGPAGNRPSLTERPVPVHRISVGSSYDRRLGWVSCVIGKLPDRFPGPQIEPPRCDRHLSLLPFCRPRPLRLRKRTSGRRSSSRAEMPAGGGSAPFQGWLSSAPGRA